MRGAATLALEIRRHAAARPLAVAVRDGTGDLTYGGLDRAADAAAAGIRASGILPGDRVALLAAPTGEAIAILVGILRSGAVLVPLGTSLTPREIAAALAETGARLLVHDPSPEGSTPPGTGVRALIPAEVAARGVGADRRGIDVDPRGPAVAVMTSGTTGRPRAALLSHAALAASAAAWGAALPPATGWLLCLGLAHVAGLGVAWRALGGGVPLHVLPVFDTARVLAILRGEDAPSHVSLVPAQLGRLLDEAGGAPAPAGLRAVLLGGASIPPELVRRAVAAGWPIIPTYGLTEAGSGVTALPAGAAGEHPDSAGQPLPGVALRIAEPGTDGVGEIEVQTPAAFSGYLASAAATPAAVDTPGPTMPAAGTPAAGSPAADTPAAGSPAADTPGPTMSDRAAAFTDDGWLRTGDLGRLDGAARLFVADRRVDLIVSGGENVRPAEVEAILASHPAIADAGVAGRPDPTWGAVPVAGIVLRADPGDPGDPGDDALRAWCRERLAPYKVPAVFVRLPALPRTAGGKLRRGELRDALTPLVVLLHATLSTGRQLAPLARALATSGGLRVIAPDRRGSGERRLDLPRPVAIREQLADLAALLDAEQAGRAILVGHSFGGVLAIEAAARLPDRVAAVVAYEPPYAPLASAPMRREFARVADETAAAFADGGRPAAARAFLAGVAGPGAWDQLPARSRAFLESEGGGAVADAGLAGLEPTGLGSIACPVTIITGTASEPWYAPIADAVVDRIPGARRADLSGARHTAPITEAIGVAAAVRAALAADGIPPLPITIAPPDKLPEERPA